MEIGLEGQRKLTLPDMGRRPFFRDGQKAKRLGKIGWEMANEAYRTKRPARLLACSACFAVAARCMLFFFRDVLRESRRYRQNATRRKIYGRFPVVSTARADPRTMHTLSVYVGMCVMYIGWKSGYIGLDTTDISGVRCMLQERLVDFPHEMKAKTA